MRRTLDRLYDACAALAALAMIGTLAMVLLGILDRYTALHLRGTDAYAGYCMAACGFLALAHTLKKNEHIRVTLLLHSLPPGAQQLLERFCLLLALLLSALLAFYSIRLAWQSWQFHDVSTGLDATPLWLPQSAMALGCTVLAIAFLDELVLAWRGQRQTVQVEEALHHE